MVLIQSFASVEQMRGYTKIKDLKQRMKRLEDALAV
jgi:hypothetical protein